MRLEGKEQIIIMETFVVIIVLALSRLFTLSMVKLFSRNHNNQTRNKHALGVRKKIIVFVSLGKIYIYLVPDFLVDFG